MQTVTLARNAMATRFEVVLHGVSAAGLQAAGEEALDEIDRLENQLSLYRPGSEIAQINARAAREPVLVSPEVFGLLQHAQKLSAETEGAFDITIAPLVRCWGFMGGSGTMPPPDAIATARELVGMNNLQMDAAKRTVRFAREGVMLDLGALGKGFAVERAAEILREAGVTSGLIHGGTSTVYAIGSTPEGDGWRIAIEQAAINDSTSNSLQLPTVILRDEAMSVSAISQRAFQAEGQNFGHILDSRTGRPTEAGLLAVVVLPSATETDALSTALLTQGVAGYESVAALRPRLRNLLVVRRDNHIHTVAHHFS